MMGYPFAPLEPGAYDMIMADPPWTFENWSKKGITNKGARGHYRTMSLKDVLRLPVASLAADDCLLWLWCTNPMLPEGLSTLASWGFEFVTAGHWHKRTVHGKTAFGTGYVLRCAGEPFLIGRRGKPKTERNVRSIVEGPIREHSRKPDEGYQAAERLLPKARRADLFSRERREGWDSWGDEVSKFNKEAV